MVRKRREETTVTEHEQPVEQPAEALPEQPTVTGSTFPNGAKSEPPGERPCYKFGPLPCGERAFLSLAIWAKVVQKEGEQPFVAYSCQVQRTYYNGGNEPKNSNTLPASSIPLAILLLEHAKIWIAQQKAS